MENCVSQAPEMRKATCDQEAWVKQALVHLVHTCLAIKDCKRVSADDHMVEGAMEGAISRQAGEVMRLCGLTPEYTNIAKTEWWFSDAKIKRNINDLSFGLANAVDRK